MILEIICEVNDDDVHDYNNDDHDDNDDDVADEKLKG